MEDDDDELTSLTFRPLDYHVEDHTAELEDDKKTRFFRILMFGKDEQRRSYCLIINDFKPFFFVKVDKLFSEHHLDAFTDALKTRMLESSPYLRYIPPDTIKCTVVKYKELYGFHNYENETFVCCQFATMSLMKCARNYWYQTGDDCYGMKPKGAIFSEAELKSVCKEMYLYESKIPPLLRFFHLGNLMPSGWVQVSNLNQLTRVPDQWSHLLNEDDIEPITNCDFEAIVSFKDIQPLPHKETHVPFKIMAMDIEADSSHGDFPLPVKDHTKIAEAMLHHLDIQHHSLTSNEHAADLLLEVARTAFGHGSMQDVPRVYPKVEVTSQSMNVMGVWFRKVLLQPMKELSRDAEAKVLEQMRLAEALKQSQLEMQNGDDEEEEDDMGDHAMGAVMDPDREGILMFDAVPKRKPYKKRTRSSVTANANDMLVIDVVRHPDVNKEDKLVYLNSAMECSFPELEGDRVTFIGSTLCYQGDKLPYAGHISVLRSCSKIPCSIPGCNVEVHAFDREEDVLLSWTQLLQDEAPDMILGYNIYGFDFEFMFLRAKELDCLEEFLKMSRIQERICGKKVYNVDMGGTRAYTYELERKTIQLASGQHDFRYFTIPGVVVLDMYNHFRKTMNLASYKLDYVAGQIIGDTVTQLSHCEQTDTTHVRSANLTGLFASNYVHFEETGYTTEYYANGAKFQVLEVNVADKWFRVQGKASPDMANRRVRWCLAKDDVSPSEIFRLTNGSADDRAIVGKYCLQDCFLLNHMFNKTDIFTGLLEMSNISSVPVEYLIMRGQSIKLYSLMAKYCLNYGYLMRDLMRSDPCGYDGADVLTPVTGYYDISMPVATLDYGSLYPSSQISENISPDMKIGTYDYGVDEPITNPVFPYDNMPGCKYVDKIINVYKLQRKTPKGREEKVLTGKRLCRWLQPNGDQHLGIVPRILKELLAARKQARARKATESDPFMRNIYEQRQLHLKLTSNSLYGGFGANTSQFYEIDVAASTTATGRMMLEYAKRFVEECYQNTEIHLPELNMTVTTHAKCIYGDTDSVFTLFQPHVNGELMRGPDALAASIAIGQHAQQLSSKFLKAPQLLEYEKTFFPLCLLSKKRYVGMMYEDDPHHCHRKEMGVVLKRRDNAPIVKEVYGGIINILMSGKPNAILEAASFLQQHLQALKNKECHIQSLTITKSLRGHYKNPTSIAHKVLADRVNARVGKTYSPGDRIAFVYIVHPDKKTLQGNKIEIPEYILANPDTCQIDYQHYITNQIMKPVCQLFTLMYDDLIKSLSDEDKTKYQLFYTKRLAAKKSKTQTLEEKQQAARCDTVTELLFHDYK